MTALPAQTLAAAKVNLGLFLGPPREDGKHEIVSVMQSVSLADELVLELAGEPAGSDEVICPGVDGPSELNLAARALKLFREATGWDAPPLRLRIQKRIPVAAGLGGGSADAAGALRLAAHVSGLGSELLAELAVDLGADVPAAITPGRWLASGSGEHLRALPEPHSPLGVLIAPAVGGLSTAAVYEQAGRMALARERHELAGVHDALEHALGAGAWLPAAELLVNDLQPAALALHGEIAKRLELLTRTGADAVFLSGSGPTVVGLYAGESGPQRAAGVAGALAAHMPPPLACATVGARFAHITRVGASQLGG
jgi:4-diphosphocytidyl-2-C-methyl-D-erythritol kinase